MIEWRRKVVQVWHQPPSEGGEYRGTAFFISERFLLTCEHVITDPRTNETLNAEEIKLQSTTGAWKDGGLCSVHERHFDKHLDVALLELWPPVSDAHSIELDFTSHVDFGVDFRVLGFIDPEQSVRDRTFRKASFDRDHNQYVLDSYLGHGMSGGPALVDGKVAGITRLRDREDNTTYVIPLFRIAAFLKIYQADALSRSLAQPVTNRDINTLLTLLQGVGIEERYASDWFHKAAPDSHMPHSKTGETLLHACIHFLAQMEHTERRAPLLQFLHLASGHISRQFDGDATREIEHWTETVATACDVDLTSLHKQTTLAPDTKDSKPPTVTVKVEPKNFVSAERFEVVVWSYRDGVYTPHDDVSNELKKEGVHQLDLDHVLPPLIGAALRSLGTQAENAVIELVLPLCLFDWSTTNVKLGAGIDETVWLGTLYPAAVRSWERIYDNASFDAIRHRWGRCCKEHPKELTVEHFDYFSEPSLDRTPRSEVYAVHMLFDVSRGISHAKRKAFAKSLSAGVPFMFWHLGESFDPGTFLTSISQIVSQECTVWPSTLRELRSSQGAFWHDLQMLWDRADHLPPDVDYRLVSYE